ncbi:unnamed protein product, partial [Choristocarpus tenellus]
EKSLEAKALRLSGDILWELERREEAVVMYLRCLDLVGEAAEEGSQGR